MSEDEYKMINYLIDKLEQLDRGEVVSCRYDITRELRRLRVDINLGIKETIEELKKIQRGQ